MACSPDDVIIAGVPVDSATQRGKDLLQIDGTKQATNQNAQAVAVSL